MAVSRAMEGERKKKERERTRKKKRILFFFFGQLSLFDRKKPKKVIRKKKKNSFHSSIFCFSKAISDTKKQNQTNAKHEKRKERPPSPLLYLPGTLSSMFDPPGK
jgi:hypothetical protein